MPIRIMIVADRREVRESMAAVIELAAAGAGLPLEVVGEAFNGLEALAHLSSLRPNVVVVDLEMPGLDGHETTRRIKAVHPEMRVIVVSIHTGPDVQARARTAGAEGFVTKGDSYEVLLEAILAGKVSFSTKMKKGENP